MNGYTGVDVIFLSTRCLIEWQKYSLSIDLIGVSHLCTSFIDCYIIRSSPYALHFVIMLSNEKVGLRRLMRLSYWTKRTKT